MSMKKACFYLGHVTMTFQMKITAKENDTNDILQTFRKQELSKRLQYVVCIIFLGRDFHYKAI